MSRRLKINMEKGESRFKANFSIGGELLETFGLPWPCFRTILNLAMDNGFPEADVLRKTILDASGIERLMVFLKERFISRTRLIKSLTVLKKAINVCDCAIREIDEDITNRKKKLQKAQNVLELLRNSIDRGDNSLKPVYKFVRDSLEPLHSSNKSRESIKMEIEDLLRPVKNNNMELNRDIESLTLLDNKFVQVDLNELTEIRHILGYYGFSIKERTACYGSTLCDIHPDIDTVYKRIDYWNSRNAFARGDEIKVYEQVVSRLQDIQDSLIKLGEINE